MDHGSRRDRLKEELSLVNEIFKDEVYAVSQKLAKYLGREYTFKVADPTEIIRSLRKEPPAHYLLEIDSFKSFELSLRNMSGYFESTIFDAEGYKWVMSINLRRWGDNDATLYISLHLKLVQKLGHGSSVNATYKFFIYDYRRKIYLVVQGSEVQRFDDIQNEHGISRVLSFSDFTNASNGFLVNGCCMFGVEIAVISTTAQNARLSALNAQRCNKHTWVIPNFSECLMHECTCSSPFTKEGRSWELWVHPKGHGMGLGNSLSLYLRLKDLDDLINGRKLFVHAELRLKNVRNEPDRTGTIVVWYTSSAPSWGHDKVALLSDLHDPQKGFKLDDKLIVEVEFKHLYLMKENSSIGMEMSNCQG
ncbi:hypothetical protein Ancab_040539 [Ancistrocladus abbreviatus]